MPQRKHSQQDIEGWGVEDVVHWFTSVKLADSECVDEIRFKSITGRKLLQLTNEELKNLRCNQSNEKRRKQMKRAVSSLPGNSISSKQQPVKKGRKFPGKSKAGKARKSKSPSPFHDPTPNPTPAPTFGGPVPDHYLDDFDEGLYDRPDEVIKAHLQKTQGYGYPPSSPQAPPPAAPPPVNSNPHQGYQTTETYEEEYEEEEFDDEDSFSSDSFTSDYEEPFEEEEAMPSPLPVHSPPPAQGPDLSRPRASSKANISILKKKFEIMGLPDQPGGGAPQFTASLKSTSSCSSHVHPSVEMEDLSEEGEDDIYDLPPQGEDQLPEDDDDDIYDKVPEEMIEDAKARQASGAPVPPGAPPPDDDGPEEIYGECEGEEDEGDMTYDIPEEALQEYQMATGQDQDAVPPAEEGIMEDIYDIAVEQEEPPASPPIAQPPRPPKPGGSSPFPPSSPHLPPKPGQSPQLPPKAGQSPQLPRKAGQSPQLQHRNLSPQLQRKAGQSPQLQHRSLSPQLQHRSLSPQLQHRNLSPQLQRKAGQSPQLPHQVMPQFNRPQLRPPIGSYTQEEEAPPPRPPKPSEPSPVPSPVETRKAKTFTRPQLSRPPIASSTLPPPRPSSNTKPPLPDHVERLSPKPSPHPSPQATSKTVRDRNHTPPTPPPIPPLPADMDKDESPEMTRRFPKPSEMKGSNLKSLEKFCDGTTSQKKDKSPETTRRFPKPSELKGSNLKSLGNFSDSTTPQRKVSPAPVAELSKSGGSPRFGTRASPAHSTAVQNRTPNGTIETKTSNESTSSDRPKASKPPLPSKNVPKIKDLMSRFEQSKQPPAGNDSVTGNSVTNASAGKPDLPPPKKLAANRSPPTGRKRKNSEEFKYNKPRDEGQAQPSNSEELRRVPSSESQPSLPPKPGAGPGRVQWQRKQIEPSVESPSISSRTRVQPDEPMPPPEPPRPPKGGQRGHSPRVSPWHRRKIESTGGQPKIPSRAKEEPPSLSQPPRPAKPEAPAPREEEAILSPQSQAKLFIYKPYVATKTDHQPPQSQPEPQFQPQSPPQFQPQSPPQFPPEELHRLPEKPRPGFKSPEASQELPKLPERLPPSARPSIPTIPAEEPPKLPSRPPPQRRPSVTSNESIEQPHLPPRPGQQQVPEQPPVISPPPLPSRPAPRHSNKYTKSQQNEPPQVVPEEPSLPARPPKPAAGNTGSPRGQSWYHSNIDRKKADERLRRHPKNGTFVIRDSTRVQGEYSLSLYYDSNVRHLRIRLRADKRFVLGEEKEDEVPFDTVMDLVSYHKGEPLVLKSGGETTLRYECPR